MAPIKKSPHVKPATRKLTRDGKIKDYFRVVPKEPPVSAKPPVPAQLSVFAKPFVPANPAVHTKPPVPAKSTNVRIDEHRDRSDIIAAARELSNPNLKKLHYNGFGQTAFERKGRAMLVEYQKAVQRAERNRSLTHFEHLSEAILTQYENEMVEVVDEERANREAYCASEGLKRERKRNYEVERQVEFEREQQAILIKYYQKMVQLAENRNAVEATLNREIDYQSEVKHVYEYLTEKLYGGNGTYEGPQEPVYIRGEYTLYSEKILSYAIAKNPHRITENSSHSWRTGTIRLGQRWGDGKGPGAEINLFYNNRRVSFAYTAPKFPSRQTCRGYWHYLGIEVEVRITFLGGAYLIIELPDIDCHGTVQLVGILDRDEEEMAEWWPGTPEWKPQPHYKTPYNPVLPQGRTRYLAPTAATGQDVRIQ
ncbi:hypothetical protein J4E89_008597 [Alternaria sp. Ai002NY15]|nr:hypothetical protein J4E89_008597 [Alternaria sp. Ai002NY15]